MMAREKQFALVMILVSMGEGCAHNYRVATQTHIDS